MKITPIEIRQKTFEKALRGYNKEEVSAFLITLSREWEHMQDEIKQMQTQLNSQERAINKLREMESSLHKTLTAAESASTNAIEQANKQAELHLKKTHMQGESLLQKARLDAESTINSAEKTAKQTIADMEYELNTLIRHYKTLASVKKELGQELTRIINDVNERAKSISDQINNFDPDKYLTENREQHNKVINTDTTTSVKTKKTPPKEKKWKQQEDPPNTSFFDQI